MLAIPLHSLLLFDGEIVSKEAQRNQWLGLLLGLSSQNQAHLFLSLQRSTSCKSKTSAINRAFCLVSAVSPPEVETQGQCLHLEYAFLEGGDNVAVIIAKDLKDEVKAALSSSQVHKRANRLETLRYKGVRVYLRKGRHNVITNDENELFPSSMVNGMRVWICQILQEISQKRTRERMSDQEAKEIKAEAKRDHASAFYSQLQLPQFDSYWNWMAAMCSMRFRAVGQLIGILYAYNLTRMPTTLSPSVTLVNVKGRSRLQEGINIYCGQSITYTNGFGAPRAYSEVIAEHHFCNEPVYKGLLSMESLSSSLHRISHPNKWAMWSVNRGLKRILREPWEKIVPPGRTNCVALWAFRNKLTKTPIGCTVKACVWKGMSSTDKELEHKDIGPKSIQNFDGSNCGISRIVKTLVLAVSTRVSHPQLHFGNPKLEIEALTPTRMTLELANRSILTDGHAWMLYQRVPIILGRPFLRTAKALIDLYEEKLTLRVGKDELVYYADKSEKNKEKNFVHAISVIDFSKDDPFSGSTTTHSDDPSPSSSPDLHEENFQEDVEIKNSNVSDKLVFLNTPLSDKDECFAPEDDNDEIDDFLAIEVSSNLEEGYFDSEGDIAFLDNLLSDDDSHNLDSKVTSDHEPEQNESSITFSPRSDPLHHEFAGEPLTLPARNDREFEEYLSLMTVLNEISTSQGNFHQNSVIESLPMSPILVEDSDPTQEEIDILLVPDDADSEDEVNESPNLDHQNDPSIPRPPPEILGYEKSFENPKREF
ncbi:hypothetical protein Tco_1165169 [Tanacetum coccineum]